MKNIILILFTSVAFSINAQEINPFERIGKEGKILTLSKGKYTEVHINDSLQRIGSVIVNMNTGTIYELLNTDTLYSEATLDPTVISRWYSPDPLASKFPMASPYMFANNNPIIYNDPDGKSGELTIVKDANGKPTKFVIKANLHFYTGDQALSKFDHKRVRKEMMQQFNDQNMQLTYDGQTLPVELDLTSDLTYSNEFNAIEYDENGNSQNLSADMKALGNLPLGNEESSHLRNNFIRIEDMNSVSKNLIGGQLGLWNVNELGVGTTTALHEFLHGLGVIHPLVYLDDGSGGYYEETEVDAKPGEKIPISYAKNVKYKGTDQQINNKDRVVTKKEIDQFIINVINLVNHDYIGIGDQGKAGTRLIDKDGEHELSQPEK
ncbi:MAG: hypothetical protein COA32_15910 [Fluviicola sp.]|nr:MAG: hypothetical protein COA32_15910 [Fluviicola sp.]